MNTINACWLPPALLVAVILGWWGMGMVLWLIGKIGDWILDKLESRPKNDGYVER